MKVFQTAIIGLFILAVGMISFDVQACDPSGCRACKTRNVDLQNRYFQCMSACGESQQQQRQACLESKRMQLEACQEECSQKRQECEEANNRPGVFLDCNISCGCGSNVDCFSDQYVSPCDCSMYRSVTCNECSGCVAPAL